MTINNVHLSSVIGLVNICNKLEVLTLSNIKMHFLEDYLYFEDVLEFCKNTSLLSSDGRIVQALVRSDQVKNHLKELIYNRRKCLQELIAFLDLFSFDGSTYTFSPNLEQTVQYSNERKFLIDLGIIAVQGSRLFVCDNRYIYSPMARKISKDDFTMMLSKRDLIGEAAEEYVMLYEKEQAKLFPKLVPFELIKHVSLEDISAGFDILSFNKNKALEGVLEYIYIEVKSVSNSPITFYWSNHEINVAKDHGKRYFLYLVKASFSYNNNFDNNLVIIQDPYQNIYMNNTWKKEIESIKFVNIAK